MTNIFIQEIKYLNLEEIKASSDILKVLDDNDIKIYVSKAEKIIDRIVVKSFEKDIPIEIKQAVILLSNCLYKNRNSLGNNRIIKSEKRRGNQIVFDTENEDYTLKKLNPCMNAEIYNLLKPFLLVEKNVKSSFFRT